MDKFKRMLRYLSMGIFLLSLCLDAYCVQDNCNNSASGFYCLTMGWLGLFTGGAFISWLANPFLFLAWLAACRRTLLAIIFSGISAIFSLSFLFFSKIMVDEAGHFGDISQYKLGYWFWLLSSVIFFLGNIWLIYKTANSNVEKNHLQ